MARTRRMSLREINSKMRRMDEAEGETRPARSLYAHQLRDFMMNESMRPGIREDARERLEGLLREAFATK